MGDVAMIAVSPLARVRNIHIERLWGHCPVQAFGTVNGMPFYFRARFNSWVFAVAASKHADPVQVAIGVEDGFCYERTYGHGNDASFMSHVQARILIASTASYYLNGGTGNAER